MLSQSDHVSVVRFINLKLFLGTICLVALVLVPVQIAHAKHGFQLQVNLFDGKHDSGKVKVSVISEETERKKSRTLDVGMIADRTGDSNIENIIFRFSDKQLPPDGAFSACVFSELWYDAMRTS
jgi:hypothetical protein